MQGIDLYRSFLFVPGNRPDRFAKALSSGADAVIIDLEDSVAPDLKTQARAEVKNFATENPQNIFWLRINAIDTPYFADDVAICADIANLAGIILPKTESAKHVQALSATGKPIVPLIETPAGVLAISEIVRATGVQRLCFGALDLMLEMDITPDTADADILLNDVRNRLLLNSHVSGLQKPIDTVYPHINDTDGLQNFAIRAKNLGFAGMLCIHPKQVATVHKAFAPSQEQLDWAQKIVDHAEASGSLAFKLDGEMVDQPVINRARGFLQKKYN